MANLHRGEIEASLGGERRILVLTLGALVPPEPDELLPPPPPQASDKSPMGSRKAQ